MFKLLSARFAENGGPQKIKINLYCPIWSAKEAVHHTWQMWFKKNYISPFCSTREGDSELGIYYIWRGKIVPKHCCSFGVLFKKVWRNLLISRRRWWGSSEYFCVLCCFVFASFSTVSSWRIFSFWFNALSPLSEGLLSAWSRKILLPILSFLWNNNNYWCQIYNRLLKWV